MTKEAIVIVHTYSDFACDDERPTVDRREIIGLLLQKPDEADNEFDQRIYDTKVRLTNITFREQQAAGPEELRSMESYIDDKVYSGWLETERVDILD